MSYEDIAPGGPGKWYIKFSMIITSNQSIYSRLLASQMQIILLYRPMFVCFSLETKWAEWIVMGLLGSPWVNLEEHLTLFLMQKYFNFLAHIHSV